MHDRNIFKTKPNFVELAKKYDYFAPFLTLDQGGASKINFKNPSALRALSKALLHKEFGLDVIIPENALIPTVPLRLNYILWLEDVLQEVWKYQGKKPEEVGPVRGIDVGTGATAVYALLCARKNNWRMIGTEVDQEYAKIALENVSRNKLSDFITIVPTKPEEKILGPILNQVENNHFAFTMCNPPFFASDEETDSVKKGRFSPRNEPLRQPPSAAKTGQATELIAEGGELQFVKKLIMESIQNPQKVLLYTTMIGIKAHLNLLIKYLRSLNIKYTTTEFVQGKTMRWGLAWTLNESVNIVPPSADFVSTLAPFSPLVNFESLIESYLKELNAKTLHWLSDDPSAAGNALEFLATENTWSNQRRKRRLEKRLLAEGASPTKIQKMEVSDRSPPAPAAATSSSTKSILLHCFLNFMRDEDGSAHICFRFRDGILGKEGLHQISQYIKNRIDRDKKDPLSELYVAP